VLVLALILEGPVEAGKSVTVARELVTFDPAEIAAKVKGSHLELPSDLVEQYLGRQVVIPKVVVNDAIGSERGARTATLGAGCRDNFKSFHVNGPDGWDLQISNQTKDSRGGVGP
jgi:hypothetical protein